MRSLTQTAGWTSQHLQSVVTSTSNLADDANYAFAVSPRVLDMTRDINGSWKSHVAETSGVARNTSNPLSSKTVFFARRPGSAAGAARSTNCENGRGASRAAPIDLSECLSPVIWAAQATPPPEPPQPDPSDTPAS